MRSTFSLSKRIFAASLSLSAQPAPFILHDGTPVRMRLSRTLSSHDAQVGETVDFEVLDDVKVEDRVVIKRGSVALATVTEAQPKRLMGRAASSTSISTPSAWRTATRSRCARSRKAEAAATRAR